MGLASKWVMTILNEDNTKTAKKIESMVSMLEADRNHMSSIINLLMVKITSDIPDEEFVEICRNFESLRWYFSRDYVSTSNGEREFKRIFMGEPSNE